ncbi:30S ribosome-binding factor RbfA [Verrucomicrobiota bacterium]
MEEELIITPALQFFIMGTNRITRINELLRREIGESLFQIVRDSDFDLAAVTITKVIISRDLRHARVLVSIMDHKDQRKKMLNILHKCRSQIQCRIAKNIVMKYTPRLSFELDTSVEKGDAMLSLLASMETEEDTNE